MSQPYGLIPITLIVLLFYTVSWGLVKTGEISLISHRRLWNILLLLTFLVTGILGILLIIQINYKIEASWTKKVLTWHVDFGIAMVGVAIIHLWRHFKYFADILVNRKPAIHSEIKNSNARAYRSNSRYSSTSVIGALIILGFISILSQLIIIREFLCIFQGNELIIGMILSIWMLLTAAGSRLGIRMSLKTPTQHLLPGFFPVLSAIPAMVIVLLYLLETQFFLPGTVKSAGMTFIFCFCLLSPFCLLSGMLYTLLTQVISEIENKNSISAAYGWESFGSLIAGLVFSIILVSLLGTFQIAGLMLVISCVAQVMLLQAAKPISKTIWMTGFWLLVALFFILTPADRWIRSLHFKNQELVYTKNTPFGNLSVTRTAGQLNYFENGNLLFSTENQIFQEEAVHFALLQHSRPETILIVSGGITGMANESFKYRSVERVDYLEINRWLAHAEMKLSSYASDPRLRIIQEDARKWIKNITAAYDVIIINTPDPSNAQINRFFTVEFFKEVKQALALGGIFSISLSPTVNYMSSEAKLINRIVYHSLKSVFQHVVVIPGEKNYFIASDGDVHLDIVRAIQSADIQNEYLQQGYIDDDLLKQNSRLIMNEISTGQARINRDLSPIAYFLQIRYWLTLFKGMDGTLVFLVMIMFALVLFSMPWKKTSAVTFGIFAGGFAGAASEFLILIIFQILYGHLYQILGILISFYMTGLASGALFGVSKGRRNAVRSFMLVQMFLFALVMLIPPLTVLISQHHNMPIWAGQTVLFGLTGGIAFMAGLEFNMASRLEKQSVASAAGNLYGVDLAGAAFGTLLVSMICLPLLGLLLSCVLIGVLILAGVLSMFVSRSKYGIS